MLLLSVGVAIVRTEFFGITSLLHRRPLRIVVGLVVLIGAAAAATGLATAGTQWWGWPASASAARASTLAVLGGLVLWPWLVRRAERLLLHGGADPADTMLRVSAALAHAEVDTLGPLVVAHLGAVLDLDFALLLTPHAQSRHQHPRSFVPVTLIEAVERRGHELIVGPQASEIVGECVQDMAVLFLLIRDGPQEPIMFCCGPKRSGEHYTRQDKTLLRALGHYVAVLFHDQGLQAQLTEQSVRLRALEGSSEPLKPEELEVLPYVAQGFTSKEIGRALNVHKRTVEKRLTAIYRKWGVSGREDAVRIARQRGLLPVEGWEGWPARNTVEARAALPGDIGRKESNG